MLRSLIFMLLVTLNLSFINNTYADQRKDFRVIYITLDGVRWQDVFLNHNRFWNFWSRYAKDFNIYGDPLGDAKIQVASVPISLPSYQSQMSGSVQPCQNNDCGRIQVETFPEYLINQLHFAKSDVATFSSWDKIAFAVEHIDGSTYTNIGNMPCVDPKTGEPDAAMKELNQLQAEDNPANGDRYDQYTYAQAIHYLEKYQPRFLWISLGDADVAAHRGVLFYYNQMLAFYDMAISGLITTLKALNLDRSTLLIITTDHGRGNGDAWTSHGPEYPESKQTFALVLNGRLQTDNIYNYSTLSIKPTVLKAFS